MNFIFRTIWSHTHQTFIAVAETARTTPSKGGGQRRSSHLICCAALCLSLPLQGAPQGGVVAKGSASISQSGPKTDIHQTSHKAIIDWQSFNVGAKESVNFRQPSANAVALNRIHDSSGTQIMGSINANGNVFLINPNGVTFGHGANVNVGGLVTSTLDISNENFMQGDYNLRANGVRGKVENYGKINANTVALLGNHVVNKGWIVAAAEMSGGEVALVAADDVTLTFGDGRLGVKVNRGTLDGLVDNQQLIQADGGRVLLRAKAADTVLGAAVNNSGVIRARTLAQVNGEILLLSDMQHGTTTVSGTLDASAPSTGNGGFIETSGARVKIAEKTQITTVAPKGETGQWLLDPTNYRVAEVGGDITGIALSALLNTTHVTIATSPQTPLPAGEIREPADNTGTDLGDITIDDVIKWVSETKLTLIADNKIYINNEIHASGDGAGLVLDTGLAQSVHAKEFAVSEYVELGQKGRISLLGKDAVYQVDGKNFEVINGKNSNIGTAVSESVFAELAAISDSNMRYLLAADINAKNKTWTPLKNSGLGFSGGGHKIKNLKIDNPSGEKVGLFKSVRVPGFVRDLKLVRADITGGGSTGAVAGVSSGYLSTIEVTGKVTGSSKVGGIVGDHKTSDTAVIRNVSMGGTVTGSGSSVGGIAGSSSADIAGARSAAKVTGTGTVGGLVGNSNGKIEHSNSTGNVTGTGLNVGGLVGISGAEVTDSSASGDVVGLHIVGGLIGTANSKVINSHAKGRVTGKGQVGGLAGWAGSEVVSSYATGKVQGETRVGGLVGESNAAITSSYATGNVTASENAAGGLIGRSSGKVTSSYSQNSTVTGDGFVGGLIGESTGEVVGSYSKSKVRLKKKPSAVEVALGGLIGKAQGKVTDSYAQGSVKGKANTGGLIGESTAEVSGSHAEGAVSGAVNVGGLVGIDKGGKITQSYASGDVTGANHKVGGLVGDSSAEVRESYATGAVKGVTNVGGLIGISRAKVSTSYAEGAVNGKNNVGGLIGVDEAGVERSYAKGGVTAKQGNAGGLVGNAKGDINMSFAIGSVSGGKGTAGGLVGNLKASLVNTYATGSVDGAIALGGLVGQARAGSTVDTSFATGSVASKSGVLSGGLIGKVTLPPSSTGNIVSVTNSVYSETTGQSEAIGDLAGAAIRRLSATQMHESDNFTGFDIGGSEAEGKAWYIYQGQTTPLLTGVTPNPNLPPLNTGGGSSTGSTDGIDNFTNPITTPVQPLGPSSPAAAPVDFDPAPFGPTAAGGDAEPDVEEQPTRSYFEDKMDVEGGGASRGEQLSRQMFECEAQREECADI